MLAADLLGITLPVIEQDYNMADQAFTVRKLVLLNEKRMRGR